MSWDARMVPNYGTPVLSIDAAEGTTVRAGNCSYHDLVGGIAVHAVGHGHPHVVAAVTAQMANLSHTSNLYQHGPGLELAKRLQRHAPDHKVLFVNSGAEANEAALKLVRKHAAPDAVVVAFDGAFHGRTLGALALTGRAQYKQGFGPLPGGIVHVPWNDVEALEQVFAKHAVAGVFLEPIQGEAGVRPLDTRVATRIQELVDASGALLVVDAVQTGIGRTGQFFGHEHVGLRPHVITLAKALGGGLPIGAALIRADVADVLGPGTHGCTFGGNPVCCAAASAVLDIVDDALMARALRLGEAWQRRLESHGLASRGRGLLQGVVLPEGVPAARIVNAMLDAGYLVAAAGDVVRIAPALNIAEDVLLGAADAMAACVKAESTH